MTRTSEAELAALYKGETARRHLTIAALLTLLHPALGYLYIGGPRRAGAAAAFTLLHLGALLTLCAATDLLPVLPLGAFLLGHALVTAACMVGVLGAAKREGEGYVLKSYNHPIVYSLVTLGLVALPAFIASHLATEVLYTTVQVADDSMYPTALPGDVLLVDRRAWPQSDPLRGELVVIQGADRAGRDAGGLVGRVIARGGDVVTFDGPQVRVNQEPLPWQIFEGARDQAAPPGAAARYIESNAGSRYLIAGAAVATQPPLEAAASITVSPGALLILGDNRSSLDATRQRLSAVSQERVIGQPRYVLWSSPPPDASSAASGPRWERIGLLLR